MTPACGGGAISKSLAVLLFDLRNVVCRSHGVWIISDSANLRSVISVAHSVTSRLAFSIYESRDRLLLLRHLSPDLAAGSLEDSLLDPAGEIV